MPLSREQTHVEHGEFGPVHLLLAGARAGGAAVVLADLALSFAAVGPLTAVAHLLPRGGVRVHTGFSEIKNRHHQGSVDDESFNQTTHP